MVESIYERYCRLRDLSGYKDSEVAKGAGITKSTFSDWKSGRYTPKQDKLQKIADFFGVSVDYLMTGEENENEEAYYINDDAREMAQFMFQNPEYKILFDASRKVKKEDIQFVKEMIDRMSDK